MSDVPEEPVTPDAEPTPEPEPEAALNYPRQVSNACLDGEHRKCIGKVALPQLRKGRRYARCLCPVCNHPKIRTMPLKQ